MEIQIECLDERPLNKIVYMAHHINGNHYKCGVCTQGDIILNDENKLMLKRCLRCGSEIKKANKDKAKR